MTRKNNKLSKEEISKHVDVELYDNLNQYEKIKIERSIQSMYFLGQGKKRNLYSIKTHSNE